MNSSFFINILVDMLIKKLHKKRMRKTERPEIDWLGLSPRAMARVMELSEQLKITPKKAFELMVAEAATQGADVKEASASRKKLRAGTVA